MSFAFIVYFIVYCINIEETGMQSKQASTYIFYTIYLYSK